MMKAPTKLEIAIGDLRARGCKVEHNKDGRKLGTLTIEHADLSRSMTVKLAGCDLARLTSDLWRYLRLRAEARQAKGANGPPKAPGSPVGGDSRMAADHPSSGLEEGRRD
jgi:hypothetical protein